MSRVTPRSTDGQPADIHDVARAAGVSITTVSHALSGKGRLSAETRDRVRAVARDLGYRGNALARGLATGGNGVLGLRIATVAGDSIFASEANYFVELTNGAATEALSRGYWLATAPPVAHPALTERLRLDGALVVDPTIDDEFVELLAAEAIPFVTTGRAADGSPSAYWVDNDHESATVRMLTHLVDNGARTVAVVSTAPVYSYILDLHRAYERWCDSRAQEPRVVHVAAPTEDAGFWAATELLTGQLPPDAIYTSFDRLGIGVLRAAQAHDVAVPGDLRVASLSDSDAARTTEPSLTTLNLHPDEIGKRGIAMLIALVNGEEPTSRHSLIESTVLERDSTKLRTGS